MDFKTEIKEKYNIEKWEQISSTNMDGTVSTRFSTNNTNYSIIKIEREGLRRNHVLDNQKNIEVFSWGHDEKGMHEDFMTQGEKKEIALNFCKDFLPKLKKTKDHPYIKEKRLKANECFYKNSLVIPVYNFIVPIELINQEVWKKRKYEKSLASIQYISKESKTFKKNTSPFKSYGFITSEEELKTDYKHIYICEGWADMVTIKMSLPDNNLVVSALSKNNIIQIYSEFRGRFLNSKIILVLDTDDRESKYNKILNADEKLGLIRVNEPQRHIKDINDLHVLNNPKDDVSPVVSKKIIAILTNYSDIFFGIFQFGMDEMNFHYLSSTENNTLVQWPPTFGKRHLKMIAKNSYWRRRYPVRKDPDDPDKITGINYDQAIEDLEVKSRAMPIYDQSKIISTGVSYNSKTKKFVCNTGINREIIGEKEKGKYYIKGKEYPDPRKYKERFLEEDVIKYFKKIATDKKGSGLIILAHACLGTIGGGLPWRPILFLNGPKNSGKTYIIQRIIYTAIKVFGKFGYGNSSEAALRKLSESSGCPMLLDEFEHGKLGTKEKADRIGDLIRNSCATQSGFKQYLCNKNGSVDQFETRSTFTLGAIKIAIEDPALLERIIFVTPNAYNQDGAQYRDLINLEKKINLEESLKGYYANLFNNSDYLLKTYEELYMRYKIWRGKPTGHFGKTMAIINAILITLTEGHTTKNVIREDLLLEHSSEGMNIDGTMNEINSDGKKFLSILLENIIKYKNIDWEQHSAEFLIDKLRNPPSTYSDLYAEKKALYEHAGVYVKNSTVYLMLSHSKPKDLAVKAELGPNYTKLLRTEFNLKTEVINLQLGDFKKTIRALNITRFI